MKERIKHMETQLKFKGNIEGSVAICNVSECTKHSNTPNQMIIPAEYCTELVRDEITISKRNYNRLEKTGKIIFK